MNQPAESADALRQGANHIAATAITTNAEAADALRTAACDLDIADEDTDRPAELIRAVLAYLEI